MDSDFSLDFGHLILNGGALDVTGSIIPGVSAIPSPISEEEYATGALEGYRVTEGTIAAPYLNIGPVIYNNSAPWARRDCGGGHHRRVQEGRVGW